MTEPEQNEMPAFELCVAFSVGPFRFDARLYPGEIVRKWRRAAKHDITGATIGALFEIDNQLTGVKK